MIFNFLLSKDTLWLVFLISSILTLFFASKAVNYFTLFSSRSKINSSSLGGILLALITSMPELVTGILGGSEGNFSLVYSNITGANSILLLFFAIFSLFFSTKMANRIKSRNVTVTIITSSVATIFFFILFLFKESLVLNIGTHKLSLGVLFQLIMYVAFLVYSLKSKNDIEEEPSIDIKTRIQGKWSILGMFVFYSTLLVISAILLNNVVSRMGEKEILGGYGLGQTLVGALFLSVITTLPEIVSMFKLMKMGLINVAISAGIGSHIFNFMILFISDSISEESLLDVVYNTNYNQQLYLWIIYVSIFLLFINGTYNHFLSKNKQLRIFNYLNIPTIFITGWITYALFG